MNKLKKWLLVILWMGLIFFLSHQPSLSSGLEVRWDFILRKAAHMFVYAVLTWLLISALGQYKLSKRQIIIWAVILAIVYAISDEYHQSFIVGRQAAVSDVLIDTIGIFLSTWLAKVKMIKFKH